MILDALEDDRYDLREVALASGEQGLAYGWTDGEVLEEDWDAEQFRARHLGDYAARCARIAPGTLLARRDRGDRSEDPQLPVTPPGFTR